MAWSNQRGAGYDLYGNGQARPEDQQPVVEVQGNPTNWSGAKQQADEALGRKGSFTQGAKDVNAVYNGGMWDGGSGAIGWEDLLAAGGAGAEYQADPNSFVYRDAGTENIASQYAGWNQATNATISQSALDQYRFGQQAMQTAQAQQGYDVARAGYSEQIAQQYSNRGAQNLAAPVAQYGAQYDPYSGAATQAQALFNVNQLTSEDQRIAGYASNLAGQQYTGANAGQYGALQAIQGLQQPNYTTAGRDLTAAGRAGSQLQQNAMGDTAGIGRAADTLNQWNPATAADQLQSVMALESWANQGPGASAAEAQLRQGLDRTVAAQMALSRSGRVGESGAAARQAQAAAAGAMQNTNAEMAVLRAQEAAQWRQQQQQAYSTALGARQGIAGQQLEALAQAGQLRATLGGQQIQGLGTAADVLARTGEARGNMETTAADLAMRQALGQADIANTIGGQDLQGLQLNQSANAQAASILSQELARRGGMAEAQGNLGAAYTTTGAGVAGQAAQLQLQGLAQDDAMRQYYSRLGYDYDALMQSAALGGLDLQQGYYQGALQGQLNAQQQNLLSQQQYLALLQQRDTEELNAAVNRARMEGDWYYGVKAAEEERAAREEAAMYGMVGTAGSALLDAYTYGGYSASKEATK